MIRPKALAPFISCILFLSFSLLAQNPVDSLRKVIQKITAPAEKVEQYYALLKQLSTTNDARIKAYAEELYAYAKKEGLPKGLGYGSSFLGFYNLSQKGDFQAAVAHYKDAREQFVKANDIPAAVKALTNLGIAYERLGKGDQLKQAYDEAVQLAEQSRDPAALQMAYRAKGENLGYAGQLNDAILYFDKALDANKKLNDPKSRAQILFGQGKILSQSAPQKAVAALEEAEQIGQVIGDPYFVLYVRQSLSHAYQNIGDFRKSIEVTTARLRDAESMGDIGQVVQAYNDLGPIYANLDDDEMALEQYQKALKILDTLDFADGKMVALGNLGQFYSKKGDHEKALFYFEKSMAVADSIGNDLVKLSILNETGYSYINTGALEKGKKCFEETLSLNAGQGGPRDQYAYLGLGMYYFEVKNYQKSIDYLLPVQAYAKANQDFFLLRGASNYLRKSYSSLGNYKEALAWTETFMAMTDSIGKEENLRKITTIRLTADFEKEKELIALEQQQKEALLKAQTWQTLIIAVGVGALAILAFGFLWNARRKNNVIATQNQQLEQLNQTKDRIFSIIGHDLRKPAIAFRGITQKVNYLLKKQDYATLERFGHEIESDALALNQLTDNLLSWALTQKNIMPYNPQTVGVAQIVADEMSIFNKTAAEKRIELVSEVPADLSVFADVNALRTIIRNLLDNAIKYTPEGGRVEMAAVEEADGVKIVISDTGIGIPDEKIKDIFLLRGGKSEKGTANEKGAGLGLHLVNELVRLNKGTIEVASQLGRGTKFGVVMPASPKSDQNGFRPSAATAHKGILADGPIS
jgi:signal transduction histidine kinase/Flp pilus assembly protein TadD